MRGHLVKRSENSWSIVVELGRDPQTGKRKQQYWTIKGTKKEAEREMREVLARIENGTFLKPQKITLGEYLEQWLRDYVSSKSPSTEARYTGIVRQHLTPALGSVQLVNLQSADIQTYYTEALKSGRKTKNHPGPLSASSVYYHHRVLYEALKHAVKKGFVARNVCEAVDPPQPNGKDFKVLSVEDVNRFLEAATKTPFYDALYTSLYTGLRRGELLGLPWRNVDLNMAVLSVTQSLQQLSDGKLIIKEPKTKHGKRQIDLPPSLVIMLRDYKIKCEGVRLLSGNPLKPNDFVFAREDGSPLRPNSFSRSLKAIMNSIGLPDVRLHDLRHTHATLMLKQGVHPKIVQERLGHANISMTLDTYSHVLPGLQKAAALRFDEALSSPQEPAENHP